MVDWLAFLQNPRSLRSGGVTSARFFQRLWLETRHIIRLDQGMLAHRLVELHIYGIDELG